MAEKRKSVSKHPYWHRRSRISTPDLLFPYLLGPELFVSPPMSTVQARPVYSTARSGSSASPFMPGYSSFVNSMASFDLSLVPSNSGLLHTESGVVEDLSIRSTTQSVFSPQMDWCRPPGPSTSYMAPVQSNPMISISSNPHSGIQRLQAARLYIRQFFWEASWCCIKHNLFQWWCTNRTSSCYY